MISIAKIVLSPVVVKLKWSRSFLTPRTSLIFCKSFELTKRSEQQAQAELAIQNILFLYFFFSVGSLRRGGAAEEESYVLENFLGLDHEDRRIGVSGLCHT